MRCLFLFRVNPTKLTKAAATASESLDADEAVVYSTKDANVWEKRQMAELDADEAVVYSSKDANVWE